MSFQRWNLVKFHLIERKQRNQTIKSFDSEFLSKHHLCFQALGGPFLDNPPFSISFTYFGSRSKNFMFSCNYYLNFQIFLLNHSKSLQFLGPRRCLTDRIYWCLSFDTFPSLNQRFFSGFGGLLDFYLSWFFYF